MKAAIIGAGLIGRAWAVVFARGGSLVSLYDAEAGKADAALVWVTGALAEMQAHGLIADAGLVLARISVARDLADALAHADHVQENIAEVASAKQMLFADIEKHARADAVLASSSSAIMPSVIFADVKTQARCLVAHPMNPPHLAPVVEICGAPFTAPEAIEKTSHFMRLCGMVDVIVEREIPGFILNRLQLALLNEAFRLIEGGYVSAADLDKTLKDGLALRWCFMGPVETMDLNAPGGVEDYLTRYGPTIRKLNELQKASPDWTDKVVATMTAARRAEVALGDLDAAQELRDRRLMALARFKTNDLPS
jgi:L-gulonate 3-dehydrogenase